MASKPELLSHPAINLPPTFQTSTHNHKNTITGYQSLLASTDNLNNITR
jgi:hypothetical protein